MAGFFDDKEEVMTIELTEWGKYLYSIGKFKPKYYAFSDDEVLYDGTYGGLSSEEQKDIENRIMDNTPYLKPHVRLSEAKGYYQEYDSATDPNSQVYADPLDSMTLVDTKIESKVDLLLLKNSRYSQATKELRHLVLNKLGSVRTTTQDYPAFDLTLIRSKIASSTNSMSSSYGYLKIPQVEVELKNLLTIVPSGSVFVSRLDEKSKDRVVIGSSIPKESVVFQDGSRLYFENNFLALDLFQNGVEYKSKNFTVEVFQYSTGSNSYDLKKLKMKVVNDNVDENGFLIESSVTENIPFLNTLSNSTTETLNISEMTPGMDGDLLSTYFDIQVDRQIPDEVVCALSREFTNRGGNLRLDYDIECPDLNLGFEQDTLNTNIIAPGVEVSQLACDEEQGGSGCRN
jgi:hypothetical protein